MSVAALRAAVLLLGAGLMACGADGDSAGASSVAPPPSPDPTCAGLYGAPNDTTGLDSDACWPSVDGAAGSWAPPAWSAADLDALRAWTLLDPPAAPASDPYAEPPPAAAAPAVCAVEIEDAAARTYRLTTFESVDAAASAGASVTHGGACGLCSTLADLAVYAGTADLTGPVRQCGLEGVLGAFEDTVACLEGLGFTPPCALAWGWNARHTQEQCLTPCVALLGDPYHEPDGSLNECLQCDEDESGDVFKAAAGRTRRNSGLATALCRPCETVWRVEHAVRDAAR